MNLYEIQAWTNLILSSLAAFGYIMRVIIGLKNGDTNKYRIMLPLFAVASLGMVFIYLFNITGWWRLIQPDYETYSQIFVRPYFTYLGSLFVLASWIHPDLHPVIVKLRSYPCGILTWLTSRKN